MLELPGDMRDASMWVLELSFLDYLLIIAVYLFDNDLHFFARAIWLVCMT